MADWWQDGIIYQIYPRSFADADGDGIGDLAGITSRLDYLAALGVDAVWLSPIYPTPDADFGYDVSDYTAIDPRMGTLDGFDRLLAEAHRRGIRVVLDLVLNHTSDQHPWFQASRSSRDNPYRDWYIWRDARPGGRMPGGRPPSNWQSVFGGPAWQYDEQTGQYYLHTFYRQQPDLNWRNPAARRALLDVFCFWLDRGVDGFRLDVFNAYFKHPALPDNPPAFGLRGYDRQRHVYDLDQPEMIPLVREIRALLDSYPPRPGLGGRYVVGETFHDTPQKSAAYMGPDKLHAAFNFALIGCPWRARNILDVVQRWENILGPGDWPNYVLNNHDVVRSATRWRTGENDARLKVAAALLLTLRGTPFLYYGEEIGMRDIPIRSRSEVKDPVGRLYWPFYRGRDGCRSPMQWDSFPGAGFTKGSETWLPLHPNAAARNVAAQEKDPGSLLNWYRRLIALRRAAPALTGGMFLPLTHGTRYLLAYLRQTPEQTVLVALNFSSRRKRLVLGEGLARAGWRLLLSTHRDTLPRLQRGSLLPMEPNEALIMQMQ